MSDKRALWLPDREKAVKYDTCWGKEKNSGKKFASAYHFEEQESYNLKPKVIDNMHMKS